MILLEGMLLVPPERGSIIGRAVWKSRYVVLGSGSPFKQPRAQDGKAPGAKVLKASAGKPSLLDVTRPETPSSSTYYISIYKAKGDWEYLAQYPLSSFELSQIRLVQHRKQAPSLPTLMLELKIDSPTERQRKRRSSRTGGLGSKDPWANTVLFRDAPDERHTIHDWNTKIKPHLTPGSKDLLDSEATSPTINSIAFSNPFAQRESRTASNSISRPDYQRGSSSTQSMSTYPHAPRERPTALISPSPSLRSRRSDLSSQASSQHPHVGFSPHMQSYTPNAPSDLPSPASTSGYDAQFVEGWTSAQGRSSALSSHTRGSNSIASVVPPIGTTPPGPRETILDRAFQMRYIPGSERLQGKDEEKISSIARFEALMREVDERKHKKAVQPVKSSFDLDEESEEDSTHSDEEDEGLNMPAPELAIRTPAQRALDYISGRTTPLPPHTHPLSPATRSPPIPFLNRSTSDYEGGYRPQTSANSSRRPASLATRSISSTAIPGLQDWHATSSGLAQDREERRRSGASTKRLSFQEFAKRLSSTSSLLLVQTNASSSSGRDGSHRGSSEYGEDEKPHPNARSARAVPPPFEREHRESRRACRGSVGVFGAEGGFL